MTYYILKTRLNEASPRIFYMLKNHSIPDDDKGVILRLKCPSIRRISGISDLIHYLEQNTSNGLHVTEPYIVKRISWNQAVDMFGIDYDSDDSSDSSGSDTVVE